MHPRPATLIRWTLASAVSAAITILVVMPIVLRIDLVPVRVLAHPALASDAMTLSYLVPVFDAVLAWLWGTWALERVARMWMRRRASGSRSEQSAVVPSGRFARATFALLALVTVVPAVLAAMALPPDITSGFGAEYRSACGSCHPSERALAFLRSREAWELTVQRHRHYAPDRFDDESVRAALEYLVAKRSLSGTDLFRVKCLVCHRESAIREARPAVEWQRIVDRISRFHPFFISPMEKSELSEHLSSGTLAKAVDWSPDESSRRELLEEGCARCHTLGVILSEGIEDEAWPEILERMAGKAPSLMREDEARELADWIVEWRGDPEGFASSFPHHRPDLFFEGVYN